MSTNGRRFSLTPRVLDIGYAYLSSLNVQQIAQPYLEALSERVHESVSVTVLDGADIVYVARVPTKRIMTISLGLGSRLPAYCTSMGRVLLAELAPEDAGRRPARQRLERHTEHTITSAADLAVVLEQVRAQGWALVDQELEMGAAVGRRPAAGLVGAGGGGHERVDAGGPHPDGGAARALRPRAGDHRRPDQRGAGQEMTAAGAGDALWARVHDLASRLRGAGADVSLSELLDAAEGVRHIDLADRAQLRTALRATLVKHAHELDRFDALFDRCFPARPVATPGPVPAAGAGAEAAAARRGRRRRRWASGCGPRSTPAPRRSCGSWPRRRSGGYGGFEDGTRTERYHVYRVLRAVELAHLLHDALRRARERGEDLSRADVAARIEALRRLITEEVRARLGAADQRAARGPGDAGQPVRRRAGRGPPPPSSPRCGPPCGPWPAGWRPGCATGVRASARARWT